MHIKDITQSNLRLFIVFAVVFVTIVIICLFSGTPHAVKADMKEANGLFSNDSADKNGFLSSEKTPRIEAICISNIGKSSVYAYGNFAYEGETLEGFKVIKIYPDKVEFEKNGKIITSVFPRP
jgi:hypothetical protein